MNSRVLVTTLVALMVAMPATAVTQERERGSDEERVAEAERRLEDARRALESAMRQLRLEEADARRALEDAMRELRAAARALGRGQLRDIMILPNEERAFVRVFGDDRARMGVILDTGDPTSTDTVGARLQAVTPGGPADEAGLRVGDVVTRVNGETLARSGRRGERPGDKLARIVRERDEGDTLRIAYRRGSENRETSVVLRKLDSSAYAFGWSSDSGDVFFERDGIRSRIELGDAMRVMPRIALDPIQIRLPGRWLDLELVTLDEQLGAYFGTTEGVLVIRGAREGGLDLQSGDVILSIDGRSPSSPSHALRIMRSYEPGESMRIDVMRNKRRMTITATVPERE